MDRAVKYLNMKVLQISSIKPLDAAFCSVIPLSDLLACEKVEYSLRH